MYRSKHDHNSYHSNDQTPQVDNIVDNQRSPQLNTTICRYNHNQCNPSASDDNGNETEGDGGGGGGGTGHFICLNPTRDPSPAPSSTSSSDEMDIEGEEGLELFKRSPSSLFLSHHARIGILPDEDEYPEAWRSPSPSSTDVDHTSSRSLCHSFAQLSTLSGTTRSTNSSAFLAFAGHGMAESGTLRPMPEVHHFIGHPIFLGHERAFCFNIDIGVDHRQARHHHPYPVQLNLEDGRSEGGRNEFSYYDLF